MQESRFLGGVGGCLLMTLTPLGAGWDVQVARCSEHWKKKNTSQQKSKRERGSTVFWIDSMTLLRPIAIACFVGWRLFECLSGCSREASLGNWFGRQKNNSQLLPNCKTNNRVGSARDRSMRWHTAKGVTFIWKVRNGRGKKKSMWHNAPKNLSPTNLSNRWLFPAMSAKSAKSESSPT